MIAVTPTGRPLVGFVRGQELVIAQRTSRGRWTQQRVTRVSRGSRLAAFRAGAAGPVSVIIGPGDRSLTVLRRKGDRWLKTALAGPLGADLSVGWPGLTLDRAGLPVVAYTRWHSRSLYSQLIVTKIDARGTLRTQRVTAGGWPKSFTPPPAAPLLMRYTFNARVHSHLDWSRLLGGLFLVDASHFLTTGRDAEGAPRNDWAD